MTLDTLLSTIILVAFLVTIVMAVGSYVAYKLREARHPGAAAGPAAAQRLGLADGESPYFERIHPEDDIVLPPPGEVA